MPALPAPDDKIIRALSGKKTGLLDDARQLLNALEYKSERTLDETHSAPDFLRQYHPAKGEGANAGELKERAKEIGVVFQVTDEEIRQTSGLYNSAFQPDDERSFIFVAVDLKGGHYPRWRLARMTRAVNRCFASPAVVLFRHPDADGNDSVSLSFIHRRESKTDSAKDVLGRVSVLRAIRRKQTHRGHLNILQDLALSERLEWMRRENKPRDFHGLLAAWLAALDTETLNKRFYAKLLAWFDRAVQQCKFPDGKTPGKSEEQIMRMITRLLFIWFVKEKGLAPEKLFTESFARETLKNHQPDNADYYRAVLQNLFFGTLNTPPEQRGFRPHNTPPAGKKYRDPQHRVFTFYRYADLMKRPPEFVRAAAEVPFVNGGLFDCLDDFERGGSAKNISRAAGRIDCFTDNRNDRKLLNVPSRIFFDEQTGLFPIFNQFKFTVAENTPLDQEVALDPELLGMVFENLLAAITPESRENARKQTGSFYTPRPIVEYMVDEALVAHLSGVLGKKSEPKLRTLLGWEDAEDNLFSEGEKNKIIAAIDKLRILDPAVGSGAFPMGMLHKLVHILSRADPQNAKWKKTQAARAAEIPDPAVRKDAMENIENVFAEKNNFGDYGRKLYLVQRVIHGADLQPVAAQIARLRFFISLVIDQRPRNDQPNRGIAPLPNLEAKFVAADSLIGLAQKGQGALAETDEVREKQSQIDMVRADYFAAKTRAEKNDLRDRDFGLRGELAGMLKKLGFAETDAARYAEWNLYDQTAGADWFDAELMMGVRDGFDIVIGNPPYVQIQKFSGKPEQKRWQEQKFSVYDKTGDVYCLFFERGARLLANNGRLCFITSNKWMRSQYGEKLRNFFASQVQPKFLLNLGPGVFDAAVDVGVFLFERKPRGADFMACDLHHFAKDEFARIANSRQAAMRAPKNGERWLISSETEKAIKAKMESCGNRLGGAVKIHRGIGTGCNNAFVVDGAARESILAREPKSAEIIKPVLHGRDIGRYAIRFADRWLIAAHNGYTDENGREVSGVDMAKNYPVAFAHMEKIGKDIDAGKIRAKGKGLFRRDDQGAHWSNLRDCAYHWKFERPKIVFTKASQESGFAVDEGEYFALNTAYIMTGKAMKYMAAILNSALAKYAFAKFYIGGGIEGEITVFSLEEFPIPRPSAKQQKELELLVDKITAAKRADSDADTSEWESEIDRRVYALYGLTPSEVRLVEGRG